MTQQAEDRTKIQLTQYLEQWSSHSGYYKNLAAGLQQLGDEAAAPIRRIGITSCSRGEGTSTVAVQLATAFSRFSGVSVVLVDANLENPMPYKTLEDKAPPGFLSALSGDLETSDCLSPSTIENLSLMTLGRAVWGQLDYCSSRIEELFASLSETSDLVLVDLPVVSPSIHWHAISRQLDGVLLVVASGQTRASVARLVRSQLNEGNIKLFGVVLNKCPA